MAKHPSVRQLQGHIAAYRRELPHYQLFASALKRVLKKACQPSLGEAVVQTRHKGLSSFAEKCVRKFQRYPDPLRQMGDLCGGRVIVQTQSQVESVRRFVEENFIVVETEDIGVRLGQKEFGYRDRHYVVRLKPGRARAVGFKISELKRIGNRKAELQIRTWAQHAWADTLHDRTYKAPAKVSAEASRTAALLAALMEESDRNFDRLATELDGVAANYAAYADSAHLHEEIRVQQMLLRQESEPRSRARLAVQLARLQIALGLNREAIRLLQPLAGKPLPLRNEVELELATALCRQFRSNPTHADYVRGRALLQALAERLARPDLSTAPNLRSWSSLQARVLSRLGWAWEAEENREKEARLCYRGALATEPSNPYYLADMIGFELCCAPGSEIATSMVPTLKTAVGTCVSHAVDGIELPFAFFTAGRLRLLLGDNEAALQDYVRGARHCLQGEGCFGPEVLDREIAWLHRVNRGMDLPQGHAWAKQLLLLAKAAQPSSTAASALSEGLGPQRAAISRSVLILAGAAAGAHAGAMALLRNSLAQALASFRGSVISGGTTAGVPGIPAEIAAGLSRTVRKSFRLIGYLPEALPPDATANQRYDQLVRVGGDAFSADQVLAYWSDILQAGIRPDEVRLLGVGGGPISALEYRVALALGATVALVQDAGGAAEAMVKDPVWVNFPNLLPLPSDVASLRAFIDEVRLKLPERLVIQMAQGFHHDYLRNNQYKLPPPMRPWEDLEPTFTRANLEQARYAVRILESAGFVVRPTAKGVKRGLRQFTPNEIERMAALEHGRWNLERLRDGWRLGPRDDLRKTHDCLVSWKELSDGSDGVRRHDRNSIEAYPRIFAEAGLSIFRKPRRSGRE